MTHLPGRIVVETPVRVGDEFRVGLRLELDDEPDAPATVVPIRPETPDH